jgi:NADP-dependent alcohol dehydrogenase
MTTGYLFRGKKSRKKTFRQLAMDRCGGWPYAENAAPGAAARISGDHMNNFSYHNPVRIEFGRGSISRLGTLLDGVIPADVKILLLYGGGSIKANGVYDQVTRALVGRDFAEFGGIEANPQYETCLRAVEAVRRENCGFILAVGGGSVLDAAKFIAAAAASQPNDPWGIITGDEEPTAALPLGAVMTLPATGSEMNTNSVISRKEIGDKRGWASDLVFPKFSILDPETTFSLPPRQSANGIVDTFVHVMEQYLTYPVNSPIQDRFAEGILLTLIEEGPKVMKDPENYDARANIFWASTMALNRLIGVGVAQDWASHGIGHELTALYGIDHGRTLAIALPGVMTLRREAKREKLIQYGRRVWGISIGDDQVIIDEAIARTVLFFESLGVPTTLKGYDLDESAADAVSENIRAKGWKLGEHRDIGPEEVRDLLRMRA